MYLFTVIIVTLIFLQPKWIKNKNVVAILGRFKCDVLHRRFLFLDQHLQSLKKKTLVLGHFPNDSLA